MLAVDYVTSYKVNIGQYAANARIENLHRLRLR